jgi:hypothetical protein
VLLGNGQKVEHAEDLLPVVPSDSEMAKDARAGVALDRLGLVVIVVGIAAVVATGVLAVSSKEDYPGALTWVGAATSGSLIGLGFGARVQAGHRASRAFTAYDLALRRHLDLCDIGGVLATCKHLPPIAP